MLWASLWKRRGTAGLAALAVVEAALRSSSHNRAARSGSARKVAQQARAQVQARARELLRAAQPAIMSLLGEIESLAKGQPAEPEALSVRLARRFTLIGVQGIVRMALAGFDVACWDAAAIAVRPWCELRPGAPVPFAASTIAGPMTLSAS